MTELSRSILEQHFIKELFNRIFFQMKRSSSGDVGISKQKKSDELLVLPQFNINVIKKRDETARILDSFSVSLQFNKLPMIREVQNIFSKQFSITSSTKFMRR